MKTRLDSFRDAFTFRLPYFIVRKSFSALVGQRRNEMWSKSPLSHLLTPVTLPDGCRVLWSWDQDAFWFREMVKEIYEDRVYERCFQVETGEVVVDVGANIGVFTLHAWKKIGKQGKVVSIEPESKNYRLLCTNTRVNNCRNVFPLNVALSDFEGEAAFYVKDVGVEHTLLPKTALGFDTRTTRVVQVEVRTLSSVLCHLGIRAVDFLKIDVEGSEMEVLKGAVDFLSDKRIKKISVAAYHDREESKMIREYLQKVGYHVSSFRNEGLFHFPLEHVYGISDN